MADDGAGTTAQAARRTPATGLTAATGRTYGNGHDESVLRSYRWRTAENSAGYLLPHLRRGLEVLDVGCGPGSITADLARLVAPGRVVGVDLAPEVLVKAAELAVARGVDNVVFERADAHELPFHDNSFDVVHAHQVLQHLPNPVAALREMRRVTRPGGVVAVRDADYESACWYPESAGLQEWARIHAESSAAHGAQPQAGRRLLAWARAAGFEDVTASASVWCFANEAERRWWGESWAERSTDSAVARRAVSAGVATTDDLAVVARAWRDWADSDDGWFMVSHGEVLARR